MEASLKDPYFFSFAQFLAMPREGRFLAALRRLPARPLTPDEVAAQVKVDEAKSKLERFDLVHLLQDPSQVETLGPKLRRIWGGYAEAVREQKTLLLALRTDHQRWIYDQAVKAGVIVPPQSIPDPRGDLEKTEKKERKAKVRELQKEVDALLPAAGVRESIPEADEIDAHLLSVPDAVEDAALDYVENAVGRFFFPQHWALHRNPQKLGEWLAEQGYAVDTDLVLAELDRLATEGAWRS